MRLIQTDPAEVASLWEDMLPIAPRLNPVLPDMRVPVAVQLAKLTHYCRLHGNDYLPDPVLLRVLDTLAQPLAPSQRYLLENYLITLLGPSRWTPVEVYALMQPNNTELGFSITRVLNQSYAHYWASLPTDANQLRLFLKKASLFAIFGDTPASHYYTKIAQQSKQFTTQLLDLARVETDEDILKAATAILGGQLSVRADVTKNKEQNTVAPLAKHATPQEILNVLHNTNYTPKTFQKCLKAIVYIIEKTPDSLKINQLNLLMQSHVLRTAILQGQIPVKLIQQLTDTYQFTPYNQDALTNFHKNLLGIVQLSITDRIDATVNTNIPANQQAELYREIIARAEYKDLGSIVLHLASMPALPKNADIYGFLRTDFGLPIFSLTPQEAQIFVSRHQTLSPNELYIIYANLFSVSLMSLDGTPDIAAIYRVLRYDQVQPFASEYHSCRDWGIFAAIKILEFHYKTNLGFPEKLNQNQAFYTYSITNRAKAWQEFIQQKTEVGLSVITLPPSL